MRKVAALIILVLSVAGAAEASEAEMQACRLTAKVKQQLKLTSEQDPKVTKIFADLAPLRKQIDLSRQELRDLREMEAGANTIESHTKNLVNLEARCRQRTHQMLKPILTTEQYTRMLRMEAAHQRTAKAEAARMNHANSFRPAR